MGVAAALVTTALIGGSLAYFQADGRNVQQQISTRTLGISLTDAQSGELPGDSLLLENAMPGENIDLENKLVVKNTGDTPLYTRVTVSKCWGSYEDDSFQKEFDKDSSTIQVAANDDWYIMENTDENHENLYLYYRAPLDVAGQTSSILKSLEIAETLTNEYTDKGIQLDVQVDAVQASESVVARQDALLAEWGVWADNKRYVDVYIHKCSFNDCSKYKRRRKKCDYNNNHW